MPRRIILYSILIGFAVWVAAAALEAAMKGGVTFAGALLPGFASPDMYTRFLLLAVSIAVGLLCARILAGVERAEKRESRRAQAALREALLRQREAIDAGNVGLWDWDLATDRVVYSREWKKQIGHEEEEIGEGFEEWRSRVHPDDLERVEGRIRTMVEEVRENFQVEFRFRHKDGSYRFILAQASVLTGDSGRPCRVLGSHVDITDRRLAEEALRESEERFRDLVSSVPGAVFRFLREPGGGYRTTFMSEGALLLFHRQAEELVGSDGLFAHLHPDDGERMRASIEESARSLECWRQEFRILTPEGYTKWLRGVSSPKAFPDGSICWTGLLAEISDQKRAEEERRQLRARLQAAQKMESLGTLAGGIAHDFNNILTPIIMQTELALMQVPRESPVGESLQEVMEAGRRARELVRQILAFSRRGETELGPMRVAPVVREALKLLRSSLPATIRIEQELDRVEGTVHAAPTQIHQVLMNLCTNAAQAMGERGGTIRVAMAQADRCPLEDRAGGGKADGDWLWLSVTDTGPGVDREIRDRIFDPFFTTKGCDEGTGMGLSVVHGIVTTLGGAVELESPPGGGAAFHLFLPLLAAEEAGAADAPESIPRGEERILLVDDEEFLVGSMASILEHLGYRVQAETDSLAALARFRERPHDYDLVITDMTMPGMQGDELAGRLLEIRPELPIVLCTGYSERMTAEKAAALGVKEFFLKPILVNDMAKVIRSALAAPEGGA